MPPIVQHRDWLCTGAARGHRPPRPPQTRSHQHPRERTPPQPPGCPDSPQLGRRGRLKRPGHRPRSRTRNRPRPPPTHLRTRHPRNLSSRQPRQRGRARPRDRKAPPRTPTRHHHRPQPTNGRRRGQPDAPTSTVCVLRPSLSSKRPAILSPRRLMFSSRVHRTARPSCRGNSFGTPFARPGTAASGGRGRHLGRS